MTARTLAWRLTGQPTYHYCYSLIMHVKRWCKYITLSYWLEHFTPLPSLGSIVFLVVSIFIKQIIKDYLSQSIHLQYLIFREYLNEILHLRQLIFLRYWNDIYIYDYKQYFVTKVASIYSTLTRWCQEGNIKIWLSFSLIMHIYVKVSACGPSTDCIWRKKS